MEFPLEIWSIMGSDNYQAYLLLMQLNKTFNKCIKELESSYVTYHVVKPSKSLNYLPLHLKMQVEDKEIIVKIIKYDCEKILIKCNDNNYFIKLKNIDDILVIEKLYFNNIMLIIKIDDTLKYMICDNILIKIPFAIKYSNNYGVYSNIKMLYEECDDHYHDTIDYLSNLIRDQTSVDINLCKIALHFANYDVVEAIMKVQVVSVL
jgi:NACalpha-BTF3-like transcription factor